MKQVFFVTEGITDQLVLEELVTIWLNGADFEPYAIQPPSSSYADQLVSPLSQGWRGVLAWCEGARPDVQASRNEVIRSADVLIVHLDADVGFDASFSLPPFDAEAPFANRLCNHVRNRIVQAFGGTLECNVVLCVPSMDLEAWVLCSLFPDVCDVNMPVEEVRTPAAMMLNLSPRLVRSSNGRIRKVTSAYRENAEAIANGWQNCVGPNVVRCPEAARFEMEAKALLAR